VTVVKIDTRSPDAVKVPENSNLERWVRDMSATLKMIIPLLVRYLQRLNLAISGFIFTQAMVDTTWTISHNLGHWPIAVFWDTAGNQLTPTSVANTDVNTTVATFSTPVDGTARLI
jgi:hypothetical protein